VTSIKKPYAFVIILLRLTSGLGTIDHEPVTLGPNGLSGWLKIMRCRVR
jgi:hypothetical protein